MEPRLASHRFLAAGPPPGDAPAPAGALDLRGDGPRGAPPPAVARAAAAEDPFAPGDPTARPLREAVAAAWGHPPDGVVVAADLAALHALVCRAALGPEDRVLVGEPGAPALTRAVLAAGARYADVGRDARLDLQEAALDRALEDGGARAAVLDRPSAVAGTAAPLDAVRRALDAGLLVVVDETLAGAAARPGELPSAAGLLAAGGAAADRLVVYRRPAGPWALGPLEAAVALCGPALAALLARFPAGPAPGAAATAALRACLAAPGEAEAAATAAAGARDALAARLRAAGPWEVLAGTAPSLLVRRPGRDGDALAAALAAEGVLAAWSPHWTWRGAVRIGVPLDAAEADRVAAAFAAAAAG